MKSKLTLRLSPTIFLCILFIFSCRKHEASNDQDANLKLQFFKIPSTASVELQKIIAVIKDQDVHYNFVSGFIKRNGLPNWSRVISNESSIQSRPNQRGNSVSDSLLFFIPFQSLESTEITSYLVCLKIDTNYNFRVYRKNTLDTINTTIAEKKKLLKSMLSVFALFEKQINQKDSLLIGGIYNKYFSEVSLSFSDSTQTGRTNFYANGVYDCYKITCDENTTKSSVIVGCYDCYEYWTIDWGGSGGATTSWWFDDGVGLGGGSGGSGGNYPPSVSALISLLNLTSAEANFLANALDQANEVLYYLQTTSASNPNQVALGHIDRMMNDMQYLTFVQIHAQSNPGGVMWWEDNSFLAPYGGANLGPWAINYLITNTQVPFTTFQNQFLTLPEGQDEGYDASYWDDPNLTFPQQNLPSWSSFSSAYPGHHDPSYDTPQKMYTSVGGQVANMYNSNPSNFQNTCALRVSKALNYSGINIPAGTDRFQGADGKYYFLSCAALLKWMKKTFGTPSGTNHLTGSQGGTNGENFPSLLSNKKGIYIMVPNNSSCSTGFCASGHADKIENGECDGGCYFEATGGVSDIFIWELL